MEKPHYERNNKLKIFFGHFDQLIAANPKTQFTLFLAVIENMAMMNIAYGHIETDIVICNLCEKLNSQIGETHRVADNIFAIITENNDQAASKKLKSEIKKIISTFGGKGKEQNAIHISSLVECSGVKTSTKAEQIFEDLYAQATYDYNLSDELEPNEPGQQRSRSQMALANQIYEALDAKRLKLAYQPIIQSKTGETSHYECLLRIIDENGNTSSAGGFIHIAEKMGIIENIDLYVLDLVLDELEKNKNLSLAFNISNLTIDSDNWNSRFFERITPEIASRLTIEITETAAMYNLRETAYFIAKLQETGCSVALDDFGSGYTSFRQIRGLSFDYVKIDGSLIKGIVTNHHNQLLVRSLIEFLKAQGLKTIAEFVDGGDTAKFLIDCGVDYMQGNYFGAAANSV